MENTFVLIFSLFGEYVCMFDGIAEHEVAEREVAECDCFFFFFFFFFYENAYFSICFFLNLLLFNDLI